MINAETLNKAGISYEEGLERFMNDVELYEMVLTAFVEDDILERAAAAYNAKDYTSLMKAVHDAKGSSGNAGLDDVYAAASTIVLLLRSESFTENELAESYNRFACAYSAARDIVKTALVR